jgi:hypothetical protein
MCLIEELFPFVYVHMLKRESLIMCLFSDFPLVMGFVRGVLDLGR